MYNIDKKLDDGIYNKGKIIGGCSTTYSNNSDLVDYSTAMKKNLGCISIEYLLE